MTTENKVGSLVVVGMGIKFYKHITVEALEEISSCEKLLYLVADSVASDWLNSNSKNAQSLHFYYKPGKNRKISYLEMADHVLREVKNGLRVCFVSYGHPGVFGFPMHEAVRLVSGEGFHARMLPGISAEDCLFADLGFDPGSTGCQTFEATDFLVNERIIDPNSSVIILQVGLIGYTDFQNFEPLRGLPVFIDRVSKIYSPDYEVFLYVASNHQIFDHRVEKIKIKDLMNSKMTALTTMFIPGIGHSKPNKTLMDKLKIAI